jgi:peptidoglycan hydrolase-like protein with peptidoglycan-binding domain
MGKRKLFITALMIGGTVGLSPASSWAQGVPGGTRPPGPEPRPGATSSSPGVPGDAAQELSKNDMKLKQQRLQEKGYKLTNVDGTTDNTTRAAIRQFQQDERIPVTGTIDELTANPLGFKYSKNSTGGGPASDRAAPSEQPSRK